MKPVIFDTGPVVAWFCPRDEYHSWTRQIFTQIPAGAFICEAVIAKVCHLVAKDGIVRGKVLEFVGRGGLTPLQLSSETRALRQLLDRYAMRLWISLTPVLCA